MGGVALRMFAQAAIRLQVLPRFVVESLLTPAHTRAVKATLFQAFMCAALPDLLRAAAVHQILARKACTSRAQARHVLESLKTSAPSPATLVLSLKDRTSVVRMEHSAGGCAQ